MEQWIERQTQERRLRGEGEAVRTPVKATKFEDYERRFRAVVAREELEHWRSQGVLKNATIELENTVSTSRFPENPEKIWKKIGKKGFLRLKKLL